MKIKTDFVTNSSSTSFIIMAKEDFTEDEFLNLMGVEKDSDFYEMFSNLYRDLAYGMKEIEIAVKEKYWSDDDNLTVEALIKEEFSKEMYLKYLKAKKENKKVYIGTLSSDVGDMSSYLCCDSFIEENEKFYFNYTNCDW